MPLNAGVWTNAEGTKELAATANQRQRHFAQHIEFSSDDVKLLLRATSVLSVLGLPALQSLDRAGLAQLTALKRHWRLVGADDASASANVGAIERVSLFERFYRTVDRRLFGRGVWVLAGPGADGLQNDGSAGPAPWCLAWRRDVPRQGHTDCLCVEYEGLPMEALEQAVRQRIGHPGGMVCARVWRLQAAQPPRLLITAWLRLDHRSLHRSVVLCAVKLPMLLNAAWTRRHRPMDAAAPLDAHAPAALSAGRQLWRLARTSLTWLLWREQWQIEVGLSTAICRALAEPRPSCARPVLPSGPTRSFCAAGRGCGCFLKSFRSEPSGVTSAQSRSTAPAGCSLRRRSY